MERWTLNGETIDIDEFIRLNEPNLTAEDLIEIGTLKHNEAFILGGGTATFILKRTN